MSEPIEVVAHRPEWRARFDELEAMFVRALGPLIERVEHVGSTAVPGLPAKPIIDVDIVIGPSTSFDALCEGLAGLGYAHLGDQGIAGREAFSAASPPSTDHHLYVCREDATELRRHLALRDHLRQNPNVAAEYGRRKLELARRFRHDREQYTRAKSDFIERILDRVL